MAKGFLEEIKKMFCAGYSRPGVSIVRYGTLCIKMEFFTIESMSGRKRSFSFQD